MGMPRTISWASLCIRKGILISHCHFLIHSSFLSPLFWLQCDITVWLIAMGHKLESCHLRLLFALSHFNTSSYLFTLLLFHQRLNFLIDLLVNTVLWSQFTHTHCLLSTSLSFWLFCPFPIFLLSCLVKMVRPAVADVQDGPDKTMASTLPHPIDLPFRPLFYNTPQVLKLVIQIFHLGLLFSALYCVLSLALATTQPQIRLF